MTSMPGSQGSQGSSGRKPLGITDLMSPPEQPRLNSFSDGPGASVSDIRGLPKPSTPISPPISPALKVNHNHAQPTSPPRSQPLRDPALFPAQDHATSPSQELPLFSNDESENVSHVVKNHIHMRPLHLFRTTSPPTGEDYTLTLSFKSQVNKAYQQDPQGWLRRERQQLIEDRAARRFQQILPANPQRQRLQHQQRQIGSSSDGGVTKPTARQATGPRPIRSIPAGTSPPRQPVAKRRPSGTPDPARRQVAPNREDKDFGSLADYCPPLDTLPDKANCLKTDWKGNPIKLDNDPHRQLLHREELLTAANLRLDCATYLTSKRRIFIKRVECLRRGKEFRKTDAQQACKIDVNKASKLWAAYDKVGWLDQKHFVQFLQATPA